MVLKDPDFLKRQDIPADSYNLLATAQKSLSQYPLTKTSTTRIAKEMLYKHHVDHIWNALLDSLKVHSKFKDIITLESSNRT